MIKFSLKISGMHCVNCANSIKKTALKLGCESADVSFISGKAEFEASDEFDTEKLKFHIKKLGFSVDSAQKKQKKSFEFIKMLICLLASIITAFHPPFFIAFVAASFALVASGDFFYRAFFKKSYGMDLLVSLGIWLNYFFSFFSEHTYFFESSFVGFIITLGKFIESKAIKSAEISQIQSFITLANGQKIAAKDIKKDDEFCVLPKEKIENDGITLDECFVDESVISGESAAVSKKIGEKIYAGSINLSEKAISLRSSCDFYENSLETLKDEAMQVGSKIPKKYAIMDKISNYFVSFILLLASVDFAIWWYLAGIESAFFYASSLLLVSCPCALALAVPMAVALSVKCAFSHQIIIKNTRFLNAKFEKIFFDKTGTLTKKIAKISHTLSQKDLDLIAGLEKQIEHPIAKSIAVLSLNAPKIQAEFSKKDNEFCFFYDENCVKLIKENEIIKCFKNEKFLGEIRLFSELKPYAKELITLCKELKPAILSGDNTHAVEKIAKELKIDEFYANLDANEKLKILKKAKNSIFVGDGLNDLKALRASACSISFDTALECTKSAADVIIIGDDLKKIDYFLQIYASCKRKIKQNLCISLIYNLITISLASGIFSGINLHLSPALCAILMSLSSLVVVFNSLLLLRQHLH